VKAAACGRRRPSLGAAPRRRPQLSARLDRSRRAHVVLLRTDPPVDPAYLEATFVLDFVDRARTALVNDPRGVRIANEKLWALQFPDLCPATLVAADAGLIGAFVTEHRTCVAKPIDGHAGRGVARLSQRDPNLASLVEMLTNWGTRAVVVQAWLDEVAHGNKRIFVHASEPVAAVTRYPAAADFRIGLPAELADLTERDHEICSRLAPELRQLGLVLAGIDVIGDHLIEVNVTTPAPSGSPMCCWEPRCASSSSTYWRPSTKGRAHDNRDRVQRAPWGACVRTRVPAARSGGVPAANCAR
jgi:glutathione synthetase